MTRALPAPTFPTSRNIASILARTSEFAPATQARVVWTANPHGTRDEPFIIEVRRPTGEARTARRHAFTTDEPGMCGVSTFNRGPVNVAGRAADTPRLPTGGHRRKGEFLPGAGPWRAPCNVERRHGCPLFVEKTAFFRCDTVLKPGEIAAKPLFFKGFDPAMMWG